PWSRSNGVIRGGRPAHIPAPTGAHPVPCLPRPPGRPHPPDMTTETKPASRALAREIGRRRTFAIISHPDAGKTTLTEKLLLFGGAIQQAGSVRARKAARHARSDWLEMEKQRGISITASVLQFDYLG